MQKSRHRYIGKDHGASLKQDVSSFLSDWKGPQNPKMVVGIPFQDEDDTIPMVVQTARIGLAQIGLDVDATVLCVGSRNGKNTLKKILIKKGSTEGPEVHGFLLKGELSGRGWSARAIIEMAGELKSPVILLTPDLTPQENDADEPGFGFAPHWIGRLFEAVTSGDGDQDLALARFSRHYLAHSVESLLVFPIMTGVFGFRLRQPMSGVCSLSTRMVRTLIESDSPWSDDVGIYGFYPWLTILALQKDMNICEVPLGLASFRYGIGKLKLIFRQTAHVLLERTARTSRWWLDLPDAIRQPRVIGPRLNQLPPPFSLDPRELLRHFKAEFNHFDDTLFRELIPVGLRERMQRLADGGVEGAEIEADEWADIIQRFLGMYRFERHFHPDDVVDGLFPFFLARLMSIVEDQAHLEEAVLPELRAEPRMQQMIRGELECGLDSHAELMLASRSDFLRNWREREQQMNSYLPRLGEWEFIPHVGVIVPQELERPDKSIVRAGEVYQELIDRYREEFMHFLFELLGLNETTDSAEILESLHGFFSDVESALSGELFPYDLTTTDGTNQMAEMILEAFATGTSFQLTEKAARTILQKAQPRDLLMHHKCEGIAELLEQMTAKEAIGLAAWTDRERFLDVVLDVIEKKADPGWFHMAPLTAVTVDLNKLLHTSEMRGTAALGRLSGQLVTGNNLKGRDGEFPKLWFFLKTIKRIIGIELFSEIWERFAAEGVDFGKHVSTSIRGHWGRRVLSAHNAFENRHQRILVERLVRYAGVLEASQRTSEVAGLLKAAASVYHLSITLPDSTFVPLCAWTWASYSFRGGQGAPTPLSSLVERDWASRDFLTAYLERSGRGNAETINATIYRLIREGNESVDLGEKLLGVKSDTEALVAPQIHANLSVPAGQLKRPVQGPILEPIGSHSWESKYVLNAAAVRLDGTIYILYRAFGEDRISRLGLAWTRDGLNIEGRLDHPVFQPANKEESSGCEDPRVVVIGNDLYMLYTAYNGELAQIAMASIPVQALLEQRFDQWKRHGLGFPGLSNKDAVIYPETFDGKWVVYHRIDPNMWISYIDALSCPWPRTGQKIVTGPRPGMMWDSVKIGAGAQPLKTKYGWLNIYHGVDYTRCYRLGVLFMDLNDPAKVIYQSPNAILEPEADFEVGKTEGGDYWVPHVVFTCGAVPARDTEVLDLDDEILVYYGAADTAIGVAKGRLRELVPILTDDKI